MRFVFVKNHRSQFPIDAMCRVLEVSRSGFYAWRDRPESQRVRDDRRLAAKARAIHKATNGAYGSPRITRELKKDEGVNHKRIERVMRQEGIRSVHRRKYVVTTDSRHSLRIAPNLLGRDFEATAPNQKWAADITYVPTDQGWKYLAVVKDLFSRRVVGWAASARLTDDLALNALRKGIRRRNPPRGLIHHSDRGSQYAGKAYQALLKEHGVLCSMSRKGDCWDNAPVESFFKTLKVELVRQCAYRNLREAETSIGTWIEGFYNSWRMHSALGYVSPAQFEARKVA